MPVCAVKRAFFTGDKPQTKFSPQNAGGEALENELYERINLLKK